MLLLMLWELSVAEQRYRAVLEVGIGVPVTEVAERYGVSLLTVHTWASARLASSSSAAARRRCACWILSSSSVGCAVEVGLARCEHRSCFLSVMLGGGLPRSGVCLAARHGRGEARG
jgi:hypothetical protein